MLSRKRRAEGDKNNRKPSFFDTCFKCGLRQGKMKNHYQQSPRCRPTATTMATRQNTYINNTEIIDTETNSDNICQSDDNSDTSSDIIINDQVSTYNNMDINASNNTIEQYLLGKEIRVPIDDNVYNIYQGNQEYSMLWLLDYCEKALCPHYFLMD